MGGTIPEISELIMGGIFPKLSFSAGGSDEFNHMVNQSGKRRIVLVGVETHICITGTALDLLAQGFEVTLALDAIGSRIAEAHSIGIARLLAAGAIGAHTESIVYEWMGTAAHEKFKTILNFVKSDSNSVDN